jgi:hypothetical protein
MRPRIAQASAFSGCARVTLSSSSSARFSHFGFFE